ncbi:MAG: glucose 1-dehydrogenase [Candidatus Latescibacterota bacterium]
MRRFEDQVVVVTGAGSGIGQAVARAFAGEGARVVIAELDAERGEATAAEIRRAGGEAEAVETDVSRAPSVEAMVSRARQRYGPVEVLVNNAAACWGNDILAVDEETWDRNLQVVLKSVYLCCRAVLPAMLERRRGAIVNVASVNGLAAYAAMPYSAAKAGVVNLTQNMALQYGTSGVRVNAVCPGTVCTPILEPLLARDPGFLERVARLYPMGRIGQPEDIAGPVLFLASAEAAWITGQALVVDGGLTCGSLPFAQEAARALG